MGWGGVGWGGVGWGGVGWGGVGWGGVKFILSNDTLGHAHSHPPSHNIRNTFDRESCANRKETTTYICRRRRSGDHNLVHMVNVS